MTAENTFRISSYLKDIIGRDLVTNEFVAIFELVKNSFDAGATKVDIEFNPEEGTIAIVDDGHGMTRADIKNKWLFVAYSEKALIGEESYRDKIKPAGQFAGSKGIGRFACDTLGRKLELFSKTQETRSVAKLTIDWTKFEKSSLKEFHEIDVALGISGSFPQLINPDTPPIHGTVVLIKEVRHIWNETTIKRLRRDLAKLIDPFGTTNHVEVATWLVDGTTRALEGVDGPVGNHIAELLFEKTSRIEVKIAERTIITTLYDRGRKIYSVREPSPYEELEDCEISGDIFYLNRSAKRTFTSRMGVRPIEFGSVFLFLNRFRIFPIGEEYDDTFGLNRRKQQGSSRYLGTRDVIGRVDVSAPPRMFREVSSRDSGLVEDARSRALYNSIRKQMLQRLERYVVGVNWQDTLDHDNDTPNNLETDSARGRVLSIVGSLARQKEVEILYYDEELVRVPDDPDQITDNALKAMAEVAESRGDASLLIQIDNARDRIEELRLSREEARKSATRALEERRIADARIELLEKQAAFLGSSKDIDVERVQLLMHQATIHLGHLRSALANAAHEVQTILKRAVMPKEVEDVDDLEDLLANLRQSARNLSSSLAAGTLSGDRLSTVLSFAPNIRIDLQTDKATGDLLLFLKEYFEVRLAGVAGIPEVVLEPSNLKLSRDFSPVDIAVIVDNLVDNARKAKATKIFFKARKNAHNSLSLKVSDDGLGINTSKVDPSKVFERGYSGSENGTGIGLYSVAHILKEMDGEIALIGDGTRADFEILIPGDIHES